MADSPQQQIDHYDFINAPQFVDFDDLHAQDDPEADRFFETHREEDDFLIPLDINTISPTVQLLFEETHYVNEANKAAQDAGLDDVKIEYYASPQQKTPLAASGTSGLQSQPSSGNRSKKGSLASVSSAYGTPLGGNSGLSTASFYTPTGGEDKENETPPASRILSSLKKVNSDNVPTEDDKGSRKILAEYIDKSPQMSKKFKNQVDSTMSLYSQLDKLQIVSSDEESDELATPTPLAEESYSTFTNEKLAFLNISGAIPKDSASEPQHETACSVSSSSDLSEAEVTLLAQPQPTKVTTFENEIRPQDLTYDPISSDEEDEVGEATAGGMELRTPVRNILRKLDAELCLEDESRCSIVVAPKVGQEVLWDLNSPRRAWAAPAPQQIETIGTLEGRDQSVADDLATEQEQEVEECFNDDHHDDFNISSSSSGLGYNNRRCSSVGSLPHLVEMEVKERSFKTFGYNPRVGITIPKTPDVPETYRREFAEIEIEPTSPPPPRNQASKNSCYFEIDAPPKNIRRVSSCSDLHNLQLSAKSKVERGHSQKSFIPSKKGLTMPRTPETVKRSQKGLNSTVSASSTSSSCSTAGTMIRGRGLVRNGPTVAERLAAAKSRQPVKANHYVSMAEAMIKFHKNTPDRFRSLPKGRVPEKRSASNDSRKRAAPTPPRSPDFATASRSQANASASEHVDKNTTIAKAFGGVSALPKKIELKPTVPKPFNFGSSHRPRAATAVNNTESDLPDFKFKARPAPSTKSRALDTTLSLRSRPAVKVTQPMSPHFASDDRLKERHQKKAQSAANPPETKKFAKPAAPKSRIPAATSTSRTNQMEEHKTTIAQPFSSSFEARQKEILRRKEEKIKQELEHKKNELTREFHANPAPKFNAKPPKKKAIEVTHAEPFRLKSDERGAAYQEAFKKKVEEEEEKLRELAKFHAQPADVLHKPPFEPEHHSRSMEGPLDIQLATEKRAAERELFDEHLREKEKEEEERRREEQEMLEELRKQEDLERRRQMVHKAQPFKEPKPFQLKQSSKPLTVPQSPAFSALPSERRIQTHSPPSTPPKGQ